MKTLGVIFSNIYDDTMGALTEHRSVASIPFAGRFRQIDFVLSSMSNAGICNVGVVTNQNYRSLMAHIGSANAWDLNRKNEGLVFLPPFATGANVGMFRGKIDALYASKWFIDSPDYDYVLLSDANTVCNIDFKKAIEQHRESGADVTVIANDERDGRVHPFVVSAGGDGLAGSIRINSTAPDGWLSGMGMFIFSREKLVEKVKEAYCSGLEHLERGLIQREFNENTLKVGVYKFEGTVLRNEDIQMYFANNMKMIDAEVSSTVFQKNRQIYTRTRDEIPTYYAAGAEVGNSIIADGCTIEGSVSDSVLFRGVKVGKGAKIRHCIIMQDAVIAEDADLEYVIFDKNCIINKGAVLKGTSEHCVIIGKDETV